MKKINRNQSFFAFSGDLSPTAYADQMELILLETFDCFEGQVRQPSDMFGELNWSHVNPASGPVYIKGVKPGDVLKIDIEDIKIDNQAVVVSMPNQGMLGDVIEKTEAVIMPFKNGKISYKGKVDIPVRPMIGVIGVAPAKEEIPNGTPDYHGGNMDCKEITAGTTLYLTAEVEGGLLGCGDLHAVMGDGEIVVTGAETNGEVSLRVSVVDKPGLPTPFLETDSGLSVIYSAKTIDEAANGAVHRMANFLTEFAGMSINDAGMLMSLVGELKFCQVVDPKMTVRFEFPKSVLENFGFKFE